MREVSDMTEQSVSKKFMVGEFECNMIVSSHGIVCEWTPELTRGCLTPRLIRKYHKERNLLLEKFHDLTGTEIVVIDA